MKATYILLAMLMSCTIAHAQLPERLQKIEIYERYNRMDTFSMYITGEYRYNTGNNTTDPDKIEYYSRDWGQTTGPMRKFGEKRYVYNSNGKVTQYTIVQGATSSSMSPVERELYFYNTAGFLDSTIYLAMGNSGWDDHSAEKYYRDSKGLITQKITYNYSQTVETLKQEQYLAYNSNGSVVADSSVEYHKNGSVFTVVKQHSYNTKGNIASSEEHWYYQQGGTKVHAAASYYHYDANDRLIADSTLSYYTTSTGVYDNKEENYRYIGTNGLLQSSYHKYTLEYTTPAPFVEDEANTYYNANGAIDHEVWLHSDRGMQQDIDDSTQYYYATYTAGSGSNSNNSSITAYPIPGGNVLNMQWTSNGVAKVVVRIADAYGKIVKQWTDEANGVYYKTIDVSSLQNGHYYIILDAEGKRAIKHISVQR